MHPFMVLTGQEKYEKERSKTIEEERFETSSNSLLPPSPEEGEKEAAIHAHDLRRKAPQKQGKGNAEGGVDVSIKRER